MERPDAPRTAEHVEWRCYHLVVEVFRGTAEANGISLDVSLDEALALLSIFMQELSDSRIVGYVLGAPVLERLDYWGIKDKPRFRPLRLNQLGLDINDEVETLQADISAGAHQVFKEYRDRYGVSEEVALARMAILQLFAERGELVAGRPHDEWCLIEVEHRRQ